MLFESSTRSLKDLLQDRSFCFPFDRTIPKCVWWFCSIMSSSVSQPALIYPPPKGVDWLKKPWHG